MHFNDKSWQLINKRGFQIVSAGIYSAGKTNKVFNWTRKERQNK